MPVCIPYEAARKRYRPGLTPLVRSDDASVDELLKGNHPDHGSNAFASARSRAAFTDATV
jgi:succinate dehydrogenase / fumarate reductase flavoprotein subunit/L-aspartate oxidase